MHTAMNKASENTGNLSRGFILDGWEVLPLAGSLKKGEKQLHLEPKVMDVLLCLARHQGEVVSRDTLLSEVWGKVIVTDDAINRCISEVRTVLGDTERQRNYIRTIPRRGYSLIFPIEPLYEDEAVPGDSDEVSAESDELPIDNNVSPPRTGVFSVFSPKVLRTLVVIAGPLLIMLLAKNFDFGRQGKIENDGLTNDQALPVVVDHSISGDLELAALPLDRIRSVAVLPFVNLSGNPDHEYFSDGLSEDIRNALMSATNLRVAARTSSMVFKNKPMDVRTIATQLNVDALLEGTVRIDNERLRITTQLTDARNGYSIWATSYERSVADKIEIQTEIAKELAQQLAPSLNNSSEFMKGVTSNVQAHDYYLLGRHHWHERTADSLKLAEEYFKQALNLDPEYALAYSGLADALMFQTLYGEKKMDEIKDEAYTAILRSLELEPDLAEAHASHGMLLEQTARPEPARNAYRKAVELKPQYSMAHMWLGSSWLDSRDVKKAHKHYKDALQLDPLHPQIQTNYAHSLTMQGYYDEALQALSDFSKVTPSEKFLKLQLEARLALGQYDEVLNLAVGHNFTGEYKPYANIYVLEALIQLQHIDKAKRMVIDNGKLMDDWQIALTNGSISVVDRDPEGLKAVADFMLSEDFSVKHAMQRSCTESFAYYMYALTDYLQGQYEKADKAFDYYHEKLAASDCLMNEPELEIAALLYHSDSKLQSNREDADALRMLEEAESILHSLAEQGSGYS
ncbi:MAG: tetratricopeptide repeat protein [Gammaproteobacteria bacterium]|nr:tetratricopeptide repeat protein [Gammaproteobacteria bacterium]